MNANEMLWLGVGFAGQLLFSLRVASQWWASERAGKSIVPNVYWLFGLCGGICLMAYGLYRRDPVILIGQVFGSVVAWRNLVLLMRAENRIQTTPLKSPTNQGLR